MNNDQLSIRFSDEIYASRSEVAKALGTNLIDGIWNNILIYRRGFFKATSLVDVSKAKYQICYLNSILEKVNLVDDRLNNLESLYFSVKDGSLEKNNVVSKERKNELYAIAKSLKININEVAINNIINNQKVDEIYSPIVNYLKALNFVENNPRLEIDVDLIAKLYLILSGDDELNNFYRVNDFDTYAQKAVIGREYTGVPVRLIEELMENLIDFINADTFQFVVKASATYYMMDYIKPFQKYNELMANLLVKVILRESKKDIIKIIPLESITVNNSDKFLTLSKETQKSRDMTYVLSFICEEMNRNIDDVINYINRLEVKQTQEEYYRGDDPLAFKEEFGFDLPTNKEKEETKEIIQDETKDDLIAEDLIEQNNSEVVEDVNAKETQKEEAVAVVQTIKEKASKVKPVFISPTKETSLVDKTYKQLEEDMLETDPELRPHQAHFYVRHNVVGKFYTIKQYKKCEGVVYETARTSMDNLAKKGYYKREQIKNKFVYTPIKLD